MTVHTTSASAEHLTARGYRRTSRRYGMVSRIDRPDWIAVLADHLHLTVEEAHRRWRLSPQQWEDFYRRVLSKDTITIGRIRALQVPPSADAHTGYVDYKSDETKHV